MNTLLTLIERKVPGIRKTRTWQMDANRWMRSYNELSRLQVRRPEVYEQALMALVNFIADRAQRELEGDSEVTERLDRRKAAISRRNREKV